jgi:hypothetical protein
MGGRGGGSGRGGGGGGSPTTRQERGKTGHLADDYVGHERSIQLLMQETGMSRAEAEQTYHAMSDYFSNGYSNIRAGHPPSAAEKAMLIDKAIKKARAYNGEIYRGIHLDSNTYSEWAKGLKKGATLDMKGISSWSSKKKVAENFAKTDSYYGKAVVFKLKSTNHAVPVQHLSSFGSREAEVLAPSFVKYKISSYITKGNITYVNLAEVG